MVGKDGGGQWTALYLHHGDDRKGHGDRAASESGDVVNNGYFFLIVMRHSLHSFVENSLDMAFLQSIANGVKSNNSDDSFQGQTWNLGKTSYDISI